MKGQTVIELHHTGLRLQSIFHGHIYNPTINATILVINSNSQLVLLLTEPGM